MKSKRISSWILTGCYFIACLVLMSGCEKTDDEILSPEETCGPMKSQCQQFQQDDLTKSILYTGNVVAEYECVGDTIKNACPNGSASIIFQVDVRKCKQANLIIFGVAAYNHHYESVALLDAVTNSALGPDHVSLCGSVRMDLSVFSRGGEAWFVPSIRFRLEDLQGRPDGMMFLEENICQVRFEMTYYPSPDL